MGVINLEKFKVEQEVEIDGKVYKVRGMTVGDYINDNFTQRMEKAKSPIEQCKIMVEALEAFSDIPKDILMALNFKALHALVLVTQGAYDENEEAQKDDKDEKKQ
jgi:hypothetical protein